jgi:hypothetical protein
MSCEIDVTRSSETLRVLALLQRQPDQVLSCYRHRSEFRRHVIEQSHALSEIVCMTYHANKYNCSQYLVCKICCKDLQGNEGVEACISSTMERVKCPKLIDSASLRCTEALSVRGEADLIAAGLVALCKDSALRVQNSEMATHR